MSQTQARAKRLLSERLKATLSAERIAAFVQDTHTETLRDNVVETVDSEQLGVLAQQLAQGSGGELRPNKNGKSTAHAPYSSAALAINAFGGWLGREPDLTVAGLGDWTAPLVVEAKMKILHGGGTANLDVLLESGDHVAGIESKLTEFIPVHKPTAWKPPYSSAEMAGVLSGGWRTALEQSLTAQWQPEHLDLEQLIKHALALTSVHPTKQRTLVYCFWEPTNATNFPEFVTHREEIQQLETLLGPDAEPTFLAISYGDLLREWDEAASDDGWARRHLAALRARYEFAL